VNAIEIQNISKMYRIGDISQQQGEVSIASAVRDMLVAPYHRIRSLITNQLPDFADREFWALKDVTFDVRQGEVMGIIGRNGAGKSTLLKILTRITAPTEGRATIRGRVGSLLEVGTGFHPELTGRENVFMNGTILGMRQHEIRAKFDEIVDFSGVGNFIDTPVKRYSSGMQVRLAFSVAAHLEPEVLLVDEVLSVGDAEFRRKCLGIMRDVTGRGRTVVIVSHSMVSIQNLCDRVVLLDNGRVTMIDSTDTVVSKYLSQAHSGFTQAVSDLTNHPNRRGLAEPTLTQLRILNNQGEPTPIIPVGSPLNLEVSLDAKDRVYSNCLLAISIKNEQEQHIARFSTKLELNEGLTVKGKQVYRCTWDDCILGPGEYSIDLSLRSEAFVHDKSSLMLDQIPQALSFAVVASDIYNTGRSLNEGAVMLWPRSRWELPEDSVPASKVAR
jgi:lipopolysaccharide transport system ATP-binding protein